MILPTFKRVFPVFCLSSGADIKHLYNNINITHTSPSEILINPKSLLTSMVTLVDVVKALKELIEITKRVEKNTEEIRGIKEEIKEVRKGQVTTLKRLEGLEYGQKEILTRLDVWGRLTKLEEKMEEVDKLAQTVAKLEEKVKT